MQRVAIARALVNDPDILLADEPTGALDSETSIQVMDLLKEIAKDRLVIMVTHNPDIAKQYSTRIVTLLDGEITSDSKPFDGEEKEENTNKKSKKSKMSFKTAFSLSLNNLMTKKGRTMLTAFAGSIGIIGIALIMSLSHGIQSYIDKTEEETLSSYPLVIQKESIDMSTMIQTLAGTNKKKEYDDDKIHSVNVIGDMFTTINQTAEKNDLKSFKEYLEKHKTIKNFVSDIKYGYNVTLNLYKNTTDEIVQVNPTTVFDTLGMGSSGMSSIYSGYMSNYNVFTEMIDNETLNKQQYEVVDGRWPKDYNELVLIVDKDNTVPDYTLYSLGVLSQKDLQEQFDKMVAGEKVEFKETSYDTKDLLNLSFKLVLSPDYYEKDSNMWINKKDDKEYMKNLINNGTELKIVGIIKPQEEAVTAQEAGMVGYTHKLTEYVINKTNEKDIVKEQKSDENKNVFTGQEFSRDNTFDYSNLSYEQMMYFQSLSSEELATVMASYTENMTATYKENLVKLGIADLEDPDTISIYPKDFDSKEEIVNIIDDYNEGKKEEDKITYTDIVGIMMSSVSSIVNVISSVLIAFVAISLVVSSIMIAIITYISVIERTKEIGILRAIGASKKDISRVFNAETLIEGAAAGTLGILVTLLLNIPINIIIKSMVNISGIAKLPLGGAIILILISIFLTVIAGFIPSKIASKKDPVVALRTE